MTRIHWAGIARAIRIPTLRGVDRDVERELQFHLDERIAELVNSGLSEEAASRQAHGEFGDIAASRDELVAIDRRVQAGVRRSGFLENAWQDLRYALRGLRREPGFAVGIAATLAIAVGANAAVFSLIDPLFFKRPPGIIDPSSLRRVYTVNPSAQAASGTHTWRIFSHKEFAEIQSAVEHRARVALFVTRDSMPVRLARDTTVATISYVTSDFLPMTSRVSRGRFFSADEDRIGAPVNVAVVSERFTQRRFVDGSDPVGQVVTVGETAYTIIGVTGGGFGGIEWSAVDLWLPFSTSSLATRDVVAFPMLLRLTARATESEVAARASLAYARVYADSGKVTRGRSVLLGDLAEARAPISGQHEVVIASRLAIVAGIVLLIACANIANLMLSRMVRRRRELAVRLALGISRRRLALQLVTESLALAVIASVAALLVGVWSGAALRSTLLPRVEWVDPVVDMRIAWFATALTVVAAVVSAIIPASIAGRLDLTTDLASGRHGEAPSRSLVRNGLIVFQTALAMMLLVGTALFARSLTALQRVDTGLDIDNLVVASAYFPDEQRHPERGTVFPDVAKRLAMHSSVAATAWGSTAPLYSWYSFVSLYERGRDAELTTEANPADFAAVSAEFFNVTGTRILRGRGFNENDTRSSDWIMVVSETMAKRLWPDEDPLGKCVSVRTKESPCHTVVGIAKDIHAFRRIEDAANRFYIPFSQSPSERSLPSVLLLRASVGSDPSQVAAMAGAELKRLLPGASITSRSAMSMLEPELRPWRLGAQLFGALGLLALMVAAVGLYGVVSFDTRQRTHELGIRIALGASSRTLVQTALRSVVRVTTIGIAVGMVGALLGGRFVSALVYGVSPRDTTSMVAAGVTLLVVAVLACLAPAIRSTRVDPVIAMRAD